MKKELKVQLDGNLENQSLARAIAAAFVSEIDPTVEEMTEIKTAVSEAFSNACVHGYGNQGGMVWMEFYFTSSDTVMIKVIDKGVGIENIAKAMEPLYTTKPELERSGMGFAFMEAFMDDLQVFSTPGVGTKIVMDKKIGSTPWLSEE